MPKKTTKTVGVKDGRSLERPDISFTDSTMELKAKIKASDPEIQNYVAALEAEKLKLQKQVAQHRVHEMTLKNWINILEAELKKEKEEPKVKDLLKQISENQEPLVREPTE